MTKTYILNILLEENLLAKYLHLLDPVCEECPKFYAVTSIQDRVPLRKETTILLKSTDSTKQGTN